MNHSETTLLLARLGSTLGAAECHGLICGLLGCMPSTRAKARWYAELVDSTELAPGDLGQHAGDLKNLDTWFEATVVDYNAADMTLQLLLPEDDETLSVRVQSLAGWCQGFCFGVGLGTGWSPDDADEADESALPGNRSATANGPSLPEDTQELLTDFIAISRAVAEDDETDESALMELQEYVRVGALLIGEEMQPATVDASQRLH